jgi:hypothetical protein
MDFCCIKIDEHRKRAFHLEDWLSLSGYAKYDASNSLLPSGT